MPGVTRSEPASDRLFIAAAIPPRPLAACSALVAAVSSASSSAAVGRVRWVRPENLHLTLRFLGATDRALVPAIDGAMRAAVVGVPPFRVVLSGAGAFPASGAPRTLWLGIVEGREELTALVRSLDARLADLGLAPGASPFSPHLTVARAPRGEPAAARVAAEALRTAAAGWRATFEVRHIQLFRSLLRSGPPRYEELATIALPA